MKLLIKQMVKELFKNYIFVALMLAMTTCTSFLYFFVHFSIDGNLKRLIAQPSLSENQLAYQNGLLSNTLLARNALAIFLSLTAFVFAMFFYRFYKNQEKQIGCLKSLGFNDSTLQCLFTTFTVILTLLGGLIGIATAYFASDLLLESSVESYQVTQLVKALNSETIVIGFFVPCFVLCFVTHLSYQLIRNKEIGLLLRGLPPHSTPSSMLFFANKIATFCPMKGKLSIRLALRKPIALLLIFLSVLIFCVMFILGYSLTLSSQKIWDSQTIGHYYLFETQFDAPQINLNLPRDTQTYLDTLGTLSTQNDTIESTIIGLEERRDLFDLLDVNENAVDFPTQGEIVIGPKLQELYQIRLGDEITISIDGNHHHFLVSGIAFNAKLNCVYLSKTELSRLLSLPPESYTGILSMNNPIVDFDSSITNAQKLDTLRRSFVSNRSSALLNQLIGCFVGCILLYLAILLNFQDSTRDILILHLMGYDPKVIHKLLLDIYRPLLLLSFFLSLLPAIQIVKSVLKSLALQIGDFMPFQTNIWVIVGIFLLLLLIYSFVQVTFRLGIRNVIQKEEFADYTHFT